MAKTKIEWCDYTFNPWRGCVKINAGCTNCYADVMSKRNPGTLGIWGTEAMGATRVVGAESYWKYPAKWNRFATDPVASAMRADFPRRPRVFCASLADVFEDWQDPMTCVRTGERLAINEEGHVWPPGWPSMSDGDDWGIRDYTMADVRQRLFDTIGETPNLDWLLLTKRPENIRRMIESSFPVHTRADLKESQHYRENLWLGTSVANQETAEQAIPELLKCRDLAAKLFLSVEPLVGPVDLTTTCINPPQEVYGLGGPYKYSGDAGIDWAIVGGESGSKARPCDIEWIRKIVDQCKAASVPCFVKQLGSHTIAFNPEYDAIMRGPLEHPKGADLSEWPSDLRVQEFPA